MSDLIRRGDVDKAIRIICNLCGEDKKNNGVMCGACNLDSFIREYDDLPSAEPERKWIPATEALPQNYQQTICIDSRGKMMIGTYGEYGWTFPCYMNEPVAWMPLPEPYRGG